MLRYKTETRPGLVALYDQETERVHSYNPGAHTGPMNRLPQHEAQAEQCLQLFWFNVLFYCMFVLSPGPTQYVSPSCGTI